MSRGNPLLSIGLSVPSRRAPYEHDEEDRDSSPRRWYHNIPLYFLVVLLLAPHPSLLVVLVCYHLQLLHAPVAFTTHLLITYTLTFLAFSSLIVILVRDPGPVTADKMQDDAVSGHEESLMEALMGPPEDEARTSGKWCSRCDAPKPERAHHCSTCGRCVLKMDHHCAWLGNRCIGHRTYGSFIHLLTCVTFLSAYVAVLCMRVVWFAFNNPLSIDENTPIHAMFLAFAGIVFGLVIGSFWCYHLYLVTTNQTTLESLSPFFLLRQLPPLPNVPERGHLSDPPQEHQLSFSQRRLVRRAHDDVRLYDVGWRKNWAQVLGWDRPWGWVPRLLIGGGGKGDGRTFPRNPQADQMLERLAAELLSADKVN